MKPHRYILITLLFSLSFTCFAAPSVDGNRAITQSITTASIQKAIDDLSTKKLSENEIAIAKTTLEQALQFARTRDENEAKLASLKKQVAEAPEKSVSYRKQLDNLTATPIVTIKDDAKITDETLQQRFNDNNDKLNNWQIELTNANNTISHAQTRPEQNQLEITSLQNRLQEIATQLKASQTEQVKLKLQAEQVAINSQINLLHLEISSSSTLQEYSTSLRNLLTEEMSRAEQENNQLQNIINTRRLAVTEKTVQDLAQDKDSQSNDLLRTESKKNVELSEYLLQTNNKLNEVSKLNTLYKQQLDTTKHIEETLTGQVNALKGSTGLFQILYQQKQSLPTVRKDQLSTEDIANFRLYQFQLNQQRELFVSPTNYVNKLLSNQTDTIDDSLHQELLNLARIRQQLYTDLQSSLNNLTTETVNLQIVKQQLLAKVNQLSASIDEKMFWLPSNPTIDFNWLKQAPQRLQNELTNISWQATISNIIHGLLDRPWIFIPVVLLIIGLLWKRSYLRERIASLNKEVGNVRHDSQKHTPLVILFNILLALPTSLALALAGLALLLDGRGVNYAYGSTLLELALGWLFFYTTYRLLSPNNVAVKHFDWDAQQVANMRSHIIQLGALSLILMVVVTIASQQLDNIGNDAIGIITVIICYLLMALVLIYTILSKNIRPYLSSIRWLMALAIVLLPVILMFSTILGYYYTSLRLTDRLIETFYAVLIWIISEAVLIRGLSVAARRIAFQRVLEKRQKLREQSNKEGEEEIIEEPVLDIHEINQQSLRLIRLLLLVIFGCTLYFIWSDVLAVFSYLDTITLYQYIGADGVSTTPLTLKAFLIALIIALVTIVLTRNLPGLLEVIILSRLNLDRGISYAITTLLSYIIIAIGVSLSLGLLGVSWSKLQWLVAALSVGLGFGLQEIFANFVSGIILLFERPMRIGDRITIGGVTGTVNRIQIRATRMTDSDKKEVIIPNKTFVTSQLINWTLTDTVTRITLQIGVDYNSDIDKVKELLLQIANDNPRVIKDPAPNVSFVNFGADTLNLELTMLVNEISDRGAATDEINRKILTNFAAENINMPFHQVEITLKNNQGHELTLSESKQITEQ